MIIHVGQSSEIETIVVRPLLIVCDCAIVGYIRAVIDLESVLLEENRITEPIPLLLCPINKSAVTSVSSQLRSEEEETTVRSDVLVVVAIVKSKHLPSETTIAVVVPAVGLSVEHRLCHRSPGGSVVAWGREVELRSVHRGKGPEDLIVVSFALALVRWNETLATFRASLMYNSLGDDIIIRCVSSVYGIGRQPGCL